MTMFGDQFYPTPKAVIEKMLEPFKGRHGFRLAGKSILEPSAGRGDIADILKPEDRWGRREKGVDCLEIDPSLGAILQSKGHRIVGVDFLNFRPRKVYDLIVMNPPFRVGHKHLLHAWDILSGGDIVCLLNAETVDNPCSEERKLLVRIIEEHGSVEYLDTCFEEAERKTNVKVALVRLHKERDNKFADMYEEAKREERDIDYSGLAADPNLPATKNLIGNMVMQFNMALEQMKEAMVTIRRLNTNVTAVRGSKMEVSDYKHSNVDPLVKCLLADDPITAYNEFVDTLTADAWTHIINQTELQGLMTNKVREDFLAQVQTNSSLAFTVENIHGLAEGLRENIVSIMDDAVVEVFDLLTRFHDENRVYVEGWKTNDQFKIGKKFILPRIVEKWDSGWHTSVYLSYTEMQDIDRVLCNLEGRRLESIKTIDQALNESFRETPGSAESTFFTMRYYMKGTCHFTFKDESLRERFCITAAKGKHWLPSEYEYETEGPIPEKGPIPEPALASKPDETPAIPQISMTAKPLSLPLGDEGKAA